MKGGKYTGCENRDSNGGKNNNYEVKMSSSYRRSSRLALHVICNLLINSRLVFYCNALQNIYFINFLHFGRARTSASCDRVHV